MKTKSQPTPEELFIALEKELVAAEPEELVTYLLQIVAAKGQLAEKGYRAMLKRTAIELTNKVMKWN